MEQLTSAVCPCSLLSPRDCTANVSACVPTQAHAFQGNMTGLVGVNNLPVCGFCLLGCLELEVLVSARNLVRARR